MNRAGKSNVLILGVLAGIFAATTAVGFYLEENERHGRLELQNRVSQLVKAKQQLEQDLSAANQEKTQLQSDVAAAQDEAKRLTAKLNDVTKNQEELQQTLAKRDETLQSLNKDLEQVQSERERLNRQLSSVQDQARTLEGQLQQLKKERGALEAKMAQLNKTQSDVELEKVVVTPEATTGGGVPEPRAEIGAQGTVLTGRILVVNREYDFVVMNVGKANGVNVGDEFEVLRDSKTVGHVKVEKIYEALSAAALMPGTDKQALREGDAVRAVVKGKS